MLDTPLNAEQQEFAETVRNSGEALMGILNDILDFDLRELVEGTRDLAAGNAHAKSLELNGLIAREATTGLRGDPGRIRQILLNLIGNAIKFTAQGALKTRKTGGIEGDAGALFWRLAPWLVDGGEKF